MSKFRFDPCPSCCGCKVFSCDCFDTGPYICADDNLRDPFLGAVIISGAEIIKGAEFTGETPFDIFNGTFSAVSVECVKSADDTQRRIFSGAGSPLEGIDDRDYPGTSWWFLELSFYVEAVRVPASDFRELRGSIILFWTHAPENAQFSEPVMPAGFPAYDLGTIAFTLHEDESGTFACDTEHELMIDDPIAAPDPPGDNEYVVDCSGLAMSFSVASSDE